jgi:adenylate kinase family enzyme
MRRVVVVGTSCSGKTTLADRVAQLLGAPHVELDAIHWGPDWQEAPLETFRARVREATATDGWVVDGNYSKVEDIVWRAATTIIWLNYPFPTVMWRALRRTIRRVVLREEIFSGNRETFRDAFLSRNSILWWVITSYRRRRRRLRETLSGGAYPNLTVFELRTPAGAERFLRHLKEAGPRLPDAVVAS